jgi:hypothetical protein
MRKIFVLAFFVLGMLFNLAISKEVIYDTSVYGINVGNIVIKENGNHIFVEGKTRSAISWLYNYAFKFEAKGDKYYLYENENGKQKVYTNEKIFEKKAWLPLLVDFIRYGEIRKNIHYPFKLIVKGNKYIIIPLKSKKVKKIEFVVGKKDRFPLEIFIDGKVDITIKRKEG